MFRVFVLPIFDFMSNEKVFMEEGPLIKKPPRMRGFEKLNCYFIIRIISFVKEYNA